MVASSTSFTLTPTATPAPGQEAAFRKLWAILLAPTTAEGQRPATAAQDDARQQPSAA